MPPRCGSAVTARSLGRLKIKRRVTDQNELPGHDAQPLRGQQHAVSGGFGPIHLIATDNDVDRQAGGTKQNLGRLGTRAREHGYRQALFTKPGKGLRNARVWSYMHAVEFLVVRLMLGRHKFAADQERQDDLRSASPIRGHDLIDVHRPAFTNL